MEFRAMRRKRQQLSEEEAIQILKRGRHCVLALAGDEEYPYAVPVNYAYVDGKVVIHGASAGHRFDMLNANPKVSLCVIDEDDVVSEKLTTAYRSVIVFGRARILRDPNQIMAASVALGMRFSPDAAHVEKSAADAVSRICCVEIEIDCITGKEGMELAKQRAK